MWRCNINKSKGFSLIELLVVIAIVAVLAAVAVPAYKKYLIKSKIASQMVIINNLNSKAIVFRSLKGYFPRPSELGLPESSTNTIVGSTVGAQYIAGLTMREYTYNPSYSTCPGKAGQLAVSFNGPAIDSALGAFSMYSDMFANADGSVKIHCYYSYYYNGVSGTDQLVPNCENVGNPNDWTNWTNAINAAVCE